MTKENRRFFVIEAIAASVLFIPLVAMQFTSEVNWTLGDFLIAAIILLGAGATVDLALRILKKNSQRLAAVVTILAFLLLVWVELAVGIFGSSLAGS